MTRFGYVMATYLTVLGIGIAAVVPMPVRLIWNASASVPLGLYTLGAARTLHDGDLVAVMPPKPLAEFMAERGYLGRDVPLLKHVAAGPGQIVCRHGRTITVDGAVRGEALNRDRLGRSLPVWRGCHRLDAASVFVMNPAVRDSLDGRYFGPLPRRTVIGTATPLYTDEAGDGHFIWRANAQSRARSSVASRPLIYTQHRSW